VQLSVLLGLAALWIVVLLPDVLRRRSTRRPADSISTFSRHLTGLERSQHRAIGSERHGNVLRFGPRPGSSLTPLHQPVAPLVAPRGAQRSHRGAQRPAAQHRAQQRVAARPAGAAARTARPVEGAPRRTAAQQRRQDVIVALIAASLLSLLATITFSGAFLVLHLVIDVALLAYVGAVLAITRRTQARAQVTYLHQGSMGRMPTGMAAVPAQQRRSVAR